MKKQIKLQSNKFAKLKTKKNSKLKFIKTLKKNKDLHIECIYDDEIACNLLYASQYYLTTIEKDKVIKYNKNKRERSLSDNDKVVLEPVIKKVC